MTSYLGIDYGGTDTKLLLADRSGAELASRTVPTGLLADLARAVTVFLNAAGQRPDGFGLTIAGTLDPATHVVGRSTNLPWLDGTDPARDLAVLMGVPGVAINDGAAAGLAEAAVGAGRGSDDVFLIVLGTGIGGAHVLHGALAPGFHGAAGELGHIQVMDAGPRCSCGQYGCLETAIGGTAMGQRWREISPEAPAGATAKDVVDAAAAGDREARRVLDAASRAFGRALLTVTAVIDPGVVVIGGGVARSPEWTVEPAISWARRRATFHTLPDFRSAALGASSGAWGAVIAATEVGK